MRNVILIIGIFLFLTSCEKTDDNVKYPDCFQAQIDDILNGIPRNPRSNIKKYNFSNQIVYVLEVNDIADEQFNVVDNMCNLICVYGGINGNQSNTCIDWDNAQYVETVWSDNR